MSGDKYWMQSNGQNDSEYTVFLILVAKKNMHATMKNSTLIAILTPQRNAQHFTTPQRTSLHHNATQCTILRPNLYP
jgi:hypothetical protein